METLHPMRFVAVPHSELASEQKKRGPDCLEPSLGSVVAGDYLRLPWASELFDQFIGWASKFGLDRSLNRLTEKPGQNYLALIAAATALFYRVEKGHNSKVHDIWDALVYCSTCCSVGYGDIFAQTPTGKAIGSLLMTIGPALSSRAVDGAAHDESAETHQQILETLRAIHAELQNRTGE